MIDAFDAAAISRALRAVGLDLAPLMSEPRYLGRARWEVEVCGRMGLEPQGTRTVRPSGRGWVVEAVEEKERAGDEMDPLGGGAE